MKLEMKIPCVPPKATSQQKGACRAGGGIRFFKKANVAAAERDLLSLIAAHLPAGLEPFSGAVALEVHFRWPYRKSEPRRNRKPEGLHIFTRPDCSNLVKMLEDALTRLGVWGDDSQVADLRVTKRWSHDPGMTICVSSLG